MEGKAQHENLTNKVNIKQTLSKVIMPRHSYLIRYSKILDGVPPDVTLRHPPKLVTILQSPTS
jgi:hypothetical protein